MKKIHYILAFSMLMPAMVVAQTTIMQTINIQNCATADDEHIITMADIALMPECGVTDLGEGKYTMIYSLEIPEDISFSISGVKTLMMGDDVTFTINNTACFNVCESNADADTRVTITRIDNDAKPCGIRVNNNSGTPLTFRNIDFEYVQLANAGSTGFDVIDCTFTHAGSALNSTAAVAVSSDDAVFNITDCTFTECEVPAVGCPANHAVELIIEGCTFVDNNTSNTNKPQLNLTVGGNHDLIVRNCTLTGKGRDKVGGIAVGNLVVLPGTNRVYIEGCTITGHRYGITGVGPMYMEIRDNNLTDNCYESNAMNGGSGISLAGYGYGLDAIISGNHIERSLWGVTLIQCRNVSLGEVDNPASPGCNTFVNNGNGGTPYDLYNNQSADVYAQLNTWSVADQTPDEIEKVIFHRHDNAALGEVIYMPAKEGASLADVTTETGITVNGNIISSTKPITIYSTYGAKVSESALTVDTTSLAPGIYIVSDGLSSIKINK